MNRPIASILGVEYEGSKSSMVGVHRRVLGDWQDRAFCVGCNVCLCFGGGTLFSSLPPDRRWARSSDPIPVARASACCTYPGTSDDGVNRPEPVSWVLRPGKSCAFFAHPAINTKKGRLSCRPYPIWVMLFSLTCIRSCFNATCLLCWKAGGQSCEF